VQRQTRNVSGEIGDNWLSSSVPDTQRKRSSQQQLSMLPVFALVAPPIVLVLYGLFGYGLLGHRLFEAYMLFGMLSQCCVC
jgi:hypothetical protein